MSDDEMETIKRFMSGNTEDMDFYEWHGELLRKYVRALYGVAREAGGGSLSNEELFGNLYAGDEKRVRR